MKESRISSFSYVSQDEGKELRRDREALTVWGLTLNDVWRATGKHLVRADLAEFSQEQAIKVYEYLWEEQALDSFPTGLDYFMFDTGLVCSYPTSARWLSISLLPMGTEYGIKQLAEVTREFSPEKVALLIAQVSFSRRRRAKAQPGWLTYGQQWTNRINRVQRRALLMCAKVQPKEELAYASG